MNRNTNVCSENMSLNELVVAYRGGKEEAFSAIYEACQVIAKGMYYKRVPAEQYGMIRFEDLFADAAAKMWIKLDSFDADKGDFHAWFSTVFWNTFLSEYKAVKTRSCADLASIDETTIRTMLPGEFMRTECTDEVNPCVNKLKNFDRCAVEEQYEQKEKLDEILECMERVLSAEQNEAMLLFYLKDMSVSEIARLQRCNENSVKSRLHQGRKKLRPQLEELGLAS